MEDDDRARVSVTELLAAAAGAGLQLAGAGPAGVVAGAMLPPAVMAAFRLDEAARTRRVVRAARALEVAAEHLATDMEGLERRALRDDASTALVARVLAAAADAFAMLEKIDALGRVLADGLGDEAKLDEALVLAAALEDLQAPHVRMLASMGQVWRGGGKGAHWAYSDHALETAAISTSMGQTAPAVMAVLVRHGLASQRTVDRRGVNGTERNEEYGITQLGTTCLVLLNVPVPDAHR